MATQQNEKDLNVVLEHAASLGSIDSDEVNDARIEAVSPEDERRIIRKVDRRLVLTLGFLYTISLMDRTNLGIAVVAGMGVDLVLVGSRYSIIVLVFFLTYVLFQPPATVILRKVGPRAFLSSITLLWGVVMIGLGFVRNWQQVVALRLLLGLLEAGFFPGAAYLLSCWYPRYELQKRNAVFMLLGVMSSAFSGILGYGFSQLAGHGSGTGLGAHVPPTKANPRPNPSVLPGIAGWRWIFILQGVLTCFIALVAFPLIVDFPEHAYKKSFLGLKFLSKEESDFVVARIQKDRHDAIPTEFGVGKYLKNALDLKVWGFAALFGLSATITYAIAYFLPIILQAGMGFNVAASQCLVAPPYVLTGFVMYGTAWWGDKYRLRSPIIIINGCLCLVGLGLLGYTKNVGGRYFGVFVATAAANCNIVTILTWQANNIRGQWKRALCSATLVGSGGVGGIIGSTVFREQDKPTYHPGMITTMLASALVIVISLALDLKLWRANKRVDAGGKPIEGLVGFKYTL